VVCDVLKGLPDAITTTWELTQLQSCPVRAPGTPPQRPGRPEISLPGHPVLDPTGRVRARCVMRLKAALNALAITFDGHINPSMNQTARRQLQRLSDTPAPGHDS
jgi:hypothetical protein